MLARTLPLQSVSQTPYPASLSPLAVRRDTSTLTSTAAVLPPVHASVRPSESTDVIAIQSMTATKQKKFAATAAAVHGAGSSADLGRS